MYKDAEEDKKFHFRHSATFFKKSFLDFFLGADNYYARRLTMTPADNS